MILTRILEHKWIEVEARRRLRSLREQAEAAEAAEPPREFAPVLRRRGNRINLLAELKKASPSRGLLCPSFDPHALARVYAQSGAAALSVLTDSHFFQGDLSYLAVAKAAGGLPVLRKDFIIDPYQVYEARAAGADAVLLIVAVLDRARLRELERLTTALRMSALVEVHDQAEMELALDCGAKIIGINNRDLSTFETDLGVTERLAPLVPPGVTLVSESGLRGPNDILRVAAAGVDAVLVGEALVKSSDPGTRAREFCSIVC